MSTRKLASVMFGLLIAGGLAAVGGGADGPLRAMGIGAAHGAETSEGWVYLGRRSGGTWKPPSASIARPVYPVKVGDKVVVGRDALVYGSVDCKVIEVGEFKVEGTPQP